MNEKKLLIALLRDPDIDSKHTGADMLIEMLQSGLSRDVLDSLDAVLGKDVWKTQKDNEIRDKLQTIALLVDIAIIQNPRPYERRPMRSPQVKRPDHPSGSWGREAARIKR